jgi:hypothetical protein
MMYDQKWLLKKVGEVTHERIPQPPKVCPVPHLFGENVSGIDTSADVEDIQSFILNPFKDRVLLQLHVPDLFRGHVMSPLDAGCVIIVERGRGQGVRNIEDTRPNAVS